MFEEKAEIAEAVERLWMGTLDIGRGEVLVWEQIVEVMGAGNYDVHPGRYIVEKFRRRLENERQIITLALPGVGLRLLEHQEVAHEIPQLRQRKAYRQTNRALRQTDKVDGAALTLGQRRMLSVQRHNLRFQRLHIGRSKRSMIGKASETNPKRRPPN